MEQVAQEQAAAPRDLLLPDVRLRDALLLAQRLRTAATQCVLPTKNGPLEVTVSQGIAELLEGDDAVRLLQRAEAAMSAARRDGSYYHNGQWPEPASAWHESSAPQIPAEAIAAASLHSPSIASQSVPGERYPCLPRPSRRCNRN